MGAHKTAGHVDNGACVRVCNDFFSFFFSESREFKIIRIPIQDKFIATCYRDKRSCGPKFLLVSMGSVGIAVVVMCD